MSGNVLVFKVGEAELGIAAECVRSVAKTSPIMPLPYMPERYRGLVNFRGDLCLAVDLAPKAGVERPFMILVEPGSQEGEENEAPTRARSVLVDSIERVMPASEASGLGVIVIDVSSLYGGGTA